MDRNRRRSRNRRDKGAQEALLASVYRAYSADVLSYALRRCGPDDAADVMAETFVVVWRRIGDVPEEPAVKPWLLGVARRVLANQRRGRRRRAELVRKVSSHLAPSFHQASGIEHFGDAQQIVEAMRLLAPADQELLMLAAWEELTPTEISVVLGVSGAIVRKRLFRARKRLAAAINRNQPNDRNQPNEGRKSREHTPESGHVVDNTAAPARPTAEKGATAP